MDKQFIFFCVNVGNENLLKKEIETFYPELTLSYSRKGFLTFKNLGIRYDLSTMSQLDATFATRVGICLGKSKPNELLEMLVKSSEELKVELDQCIVHSFSINTDYILNTNEILKKEVNGYSSNEKVVFDVMALSESEVWLGVHTVDKGVTRFPNSHVEIEIPSHSPSKAYLKLAQIVELYAIKFDRNDGWLDFGSSPGGASLFLLSRGCRVVGIDPAKMSPAITRNTKYTHISTAVQNLSHEKLPNSKITWVHVDLNLRPTQAIKEVLRLCKKYNFSLKGIIFTVQLTNVDYIRDIEEFEEQFYDWGFSEINSIQVPAHKNEYAIIARVASKRR